MVFSAFSQTFAVSPNHAVPQEDASVAILLATLNGERYLPEQLDSIRAQTHGRWTLWASDDASVDRTRAVLEDYRSRFANLNAGSALRTSDACFSNVAGETTGERLQILTGPARGFVANFLSLACHPDIEADYFAFCDQDDIWVPGKLTRALDLLSACGQNHPALYCARTELIDAQGRPIGFSPRFGRPPSFANALVQSLAGGNTMVFNRPARALLMQAGASADVITHDWWLYLLVTACGGTVIYDAEPLTRYRQHAHNLVGANRSWRARFDRIRMLFRGDFRHSIDRHFLALDAVQGQMSAEHLLLLERFRRARQLPFWQRLDQFRQCRLYRQTPFGNAGLLAGLCFNKI